MFIFNYLLYGFRMCYKLLLKVKYWLFKAMKSFLLKIATIMPNFIQNDILSTELMSALIGALIGGLFTCLGVYLQIRQQRIIEDSKQIKEEQDKMIYLHYLMRDSYSTIEEIARKSISPSTGNPFLIGGLGSVPLNNSVKSIAEDINQEQYFLASINQLKDRRFGEIFSLYNDLNTRIKNIIARNDKIQNLFVDEKYNVLAARGKLFNELRLYVHRSKDGISNNNKRQKIYNDLNNILLEIEKNERGSFQEDNYEKGLHLYYSIVEILKEGDTDEEKALLLIAQETYYKDFNFRVKSTNMYNSMITEGAQMEDILKKHT